MSWRCASRLAVRSFVPRIDTDSDTVAAKRYFDQAFKLEDILTKIPIVRKPDISNLAWQARIYHAHLVPHVDF